MSVNSIATITPCIVPSSLANQKKVNSGDCYIEQLIHKYIFNSKISSESFSYWDGNSSNGSTGLPDILMKSPSLPLIMAGTNCLHDKFSLTRHQEPNLFLDLIDSRFVSLAFVGLHGSKAFNAKHHFDFFDDSKILLRKILENGLISARCKTTYDSLCQAFPKFSDKILLTGCISAAPNINVLKNFQINNLDQAQILFSFTCRNDSVDAEVADLRYLISIFGPKFVNIILNQNRIPDKMKALILENNLKVFDAAKMNVIQYYTFLSSFDLHIGSRAHVHIPLCSMGIRSFLTGFEQRHSAFQQHYESLSLKIGSISKYTPVFFLYEKDFVFLQQRLCADMIERTKYKTLLKKNIQTDSTSFNVTDENQWLVRQQKLLEILPIYSINAVTELGPGFGKLADKLIQNGISYRGFDIIKRRKYISQYDVNTQPPIPPRDKSDVLVLLGVLEYIENPLFFIQNWITKYSITVFTYNAVCESRSMNLYGQCYSEDIRATLGWKNSYSLNQLKALLHSNGLTILDINETKYNENNRIYCEYMFVVKK